MNAVGKFHAESLKFDKRLIRMNEKSGLLAPGEYERTVEALPDLKDNAVAINLKGDAGVEAVSPSVEENPVQKGFQGTTENTGFGSSVESSDTADTPTSGNTSGGGFFGV